MKGLNVVFAGDATYVPHMATSIVSLLENSGEHVGRVFVMTDQHGVEELGDFPNVLRRRYELDLEVIVADMADVQGLWATGHISTGAYFRFLVGNLLPSELNHVLYLDSDLLVVRPLSTLIPIVDEMERLDGDPGQKGHTLYAVARHEPPHLRRFGYQSDRYFNSGVMLINLRSWRRDKLGEILIEKAKELHGKLDLHDQDVLNLVFEENWGELPGRLNEVSAETITDESVVIHFAGSSKPWMVGNKHPKAGLYRHYRSLTPFYPYKREQLGRYLHRRLVPKVFRDWKKTKRRTKRSINRFLRRLKQSLR